MTAAFPLPVAAEPTVVLGIAGSESAMIGLRALIERFADERPGVEFRFEPALGTSGALRALKARAIDIAAIAQRPETITADSARPWVVYAQTPVFFAASPDVEQKGVALAEAAAIWRGERRRWSDGGTIHLLVRHAGSPITDCLRQASAEMKAAVDAALSRRGVRIVIDAGDMLRELELNEGAFGVITLAQWIGEGSSARPLALQGVPPSLAHVADGTYPLRLAFALALSDRAPPAAVQFAAFVRSAAARPLLEASGQLPFGGEEG